METNIITTRQLRAIDEFFAANGDENEVLKNFSISPARWKRWQTQQPFNRAFEAKMSALNRQGQVILLQNTSWVTARLLELCNSPKEEVSRKACLNVLQLNNETIEKNITPETDEPRQTNLTHEQAAKILAVLSEDMSSRP
jgi:hypothetical protein